MLTVRRRVSIRGAIMIGGQRIQAGLLEDAGCVQVRKGAIGRRPRTWFRLTAAGRRAVEGHLAWLAQLEEAVSASTRDAQQARPLPGDRDQPRRVLPPLLGSS